MTRPRTQPTTAPETTVSGAAPTLAALIDAAVLEGVLPDDSWVHVVHSGVTCHPPEPGTPGALWLTIEEFQ